jgi:hypothetical protein
MKTRNLKLSILILLTAVSTLSCNKVIDLNLGNDSGKLVIEGNVTNVTGMQNVVLSRNVPFTSPNTYPAVTGATVSVSDDKGNNYPFTEGPAGTYSNGHLYGVAGTTYTMTVLTGGVTYKASSEMPPLVPLDSITSKTNDFNDRNNRREITVHFQDPPGEPNQYKFLLFVNNVQVDAIFAIDDEFTDGRYVNLDLVENQTDIYPGDTVRVEMQCLDKPIYTYWFTLAQQQQDTPGGGVAPSNPPTNITPDALGYFSAHTTQSITLVVK